MKTSKKWPDFASLENTIGIIFKNQSYLKNAFIHRSYLNEMKDSKSTSNERLEFLGDSVLSLVVSNFLYQTLPQSTEGNLTKLRASLVRTETLSKVAKSLNLGSYLLLSKGEEETGGRENTSILANTLEALIGAIYQDQGIEKTQLLIEKTILAKWKQLTKSAVTDNKSKLQEISQRKLRLSPNYKLLESWGPDHARQFKLGVYLGEKLMGIGTGKNKQEAAQEAARSALSRLRRQTLA